MSADVLVLGQGLAGTVLAWELERAGVAFAIVDPGHAHAASAAAAGIVNPVTGRRLVKSWNIDALLPLARAAYRELEHALGARLWHEVRVRRLFADERERSTLAAKRSSGELAPFLGAVDEDGCWIEHAGRVDLPALLAAARTRWEKSGQLRVGHADPAQEANRHALVIDCRGVAAARGGEFAFVPWEFSRGDILELSVAGLDQDVILNRRHWIAPLRPGVAWVGATHEPGIVDAAPTTAARETLEASARTILGERSFAVTGQRVGVRVNLPDKRPIAGRHPVRRELGVLSGLGAKGALWAPWLARQWAEHLSRGAAFAAEVEVARFVGPGR